MHSSRFLDEQLSNRLEELSNLLGVLSQQLSAVEIAAVEAPTTESPTVYQRLLKCQSIFQEIVTYLAERDITPAVEQLVRPAQTEAHRLLRLMGVDAMRWRTAKQSVMAEKLRSQLLAQTERLQGFVQVIADALADNLANNLADTLQETDD